MSDEFWAGVWLVMVFLFTFFVGVAVGAGVREAKMCEKLRIGGDTTAVALYICGGR